MLPTLYQVPDSPLGIHMYGLMVLLAFVAAFGLVHVRCRAIGIHPEQMIPVYGAAAFAGLLGGRLTYAFVVTPARTFADPLSVLDFTGGYVYYGGVLGGAAGVFGWAAFRGLQGWKLADLIGPALVLGLGVGRLGCFFAGCCHGAAAPVDASAHALLPEGLLHGQIWLQSHFPFVTTEFYDGVGRLLHVPLYPTQLWSAAAGIGLAALLAWRWPSRRFDGEIAGLTLVLEPIARFLIESFRADHRGYALSWAVGADSVLARVPGLSAAGSTLQDATGTVTIGVTTSQAIGVVLMVVGVVILATGPRRGRAPEQPIEGGDDLQ